MDRFQKQKFARRDDVCDWTVTIRKFLGRIGYSVGLFGLNRFFKTVPPTGGNNGPVSAVVGCRVLWS